LPSQIPSAMLGQVLALTVMAIAKSATPPP
jgi:hypothetical protein